MAKKLLRKLLTSSFILFFYAFSVVGQTKVNLIQDPSFEDTTTMQEIPGGGQQANMHHWKNLDSLKPLSCMFFLFNFNQTDPSFVLPSNFYYNYQVPSSGSGFIDPTNYYIVPNQGHPPTIRSVARGKLYSKLIAGKKYCAKAKLAPMEVEAWFTNGFGMYFDNGQLDTIVAKDSSGIYPFVQAQVQAQQIINDTMNWTEVQGTFIANGTETMVSLGNFLSDSATQKQVNNVGVCDCGDVGVDDVSLIATDISNWLQDVPMAPGDSVYIGLPKYEVPDALWYNMQGQQIGKGSGIFVKPTAATTSYIQAIDVCDRIARDTITVYIYPAALVNATYLTGLKLFPNPASQQITISQVNTEIITISDAIGRKIISIQPRDYSTTIDISNLSNGLYFAESKNGKVRFLKE